MPEPGAFHIMALSKLVFVWAYFGIVQSWQGCCNEDEGFIREFTCGHLYYRKLHLNEADGLLYVGAMDRLFRLDADDVGKYDCEGDSLLAEATDVEKCMGQGKNEQFECRNHIRVIEDIGDGMMYVCGTNAYSPRDFIIYSDLRHLPRHVHVGHVGSGVGRCPGAPDQPVATAWAGAPHQALVSGTHADSALSDRPFVRWDLRVGGYKRTPRYNTKWLDGPVFLDAFVRGEHAYAVVRERGSCDRHAARIVRVCLNDKGSARHPREWTTFTKVTLSCGAPHYGYLASVHRTSKDPDHIYAVFTNGSHSAFGGSLICQFSLSDVDSSFAGRFLLSTGSRVPEPRPGSCVPDTGSLPDEIVNFIRSHPLMLEAVKVDPVYVQKDVQFSSVIVDRIHDCLVYYCGTDSGSVYVVVQPDFKNRTAYLLDVWKIFQDEPINTIVLSVKSSSIYFASDYRIRQIKPSSVCRRHYGSCTRCSRNPYCGWDVNGDTCEPFTKGLFQDLTDSGFDCQSFARPKFVKAVYGQSVLLANEYESIEEVGFRWSRRKSIDDEAELIVSSERFVLTVNHSLVILGLGVNDGGLFECWLGSKVVAAYNISVDVGRCGEAVRNGSYHRVYLDWCRQFFRHKDAMSRWQVQNDLRCRENSDWKYDGTNNVVPVR